MRRYLLLCVLLTVTAAYGKFIPDPIVRYKIDARLDAVQKSIKGREVIVWKNHTTDTIPDLQFHLYLNAFKNNHSTFMRESGGENRGNHFDHRHWGYEQIHTIKVDGRDLTSKLEYIQPDDGNPDDQTVARVVLPRPIGPHESVTIEIDWTSQMPMIFARTGFQDNYFLVGQWFPKPGVYEAAGERHRERGGWNCHQFHANTEFYADYGIFDVNLTVPSDFELAATGEQRSAIANPDGTTTYNHYEEDVHDFAWVTQPKSQAMKVVREFKAGEMVSPAEIQEWSRKTGASPDDVKLQDVKVTLFIQREHASQIERHFRAAFAGIKWFGLMYGKYPYDVLTVVDPPYGARGSGGMEYPTFITAGTSFWPASKALSPEGVTVHEFGHQFWYGLVGNNEFEEAWLDEGFNSYSTGKVLEREYGPNHEYHRLWGVPISGTAWLDLPMPRYPWYGVGQVGIGQYWEDVALPEAYGRQGYARWASMDAMERPGYRDFNSPSYGVQAYAKPELTLRTLEGVLGDVWPKVIRTYQQRYRFKHPDAIDFMNTVNELSGCDMRWFFDQTVYGTGMLNYAVSFTNDRAPRREGYFDQNRQPQLVQAQRRSGEDKDQPVESEVVIRRLGEMQFPVVVHIKFEDGGEVNEHWDGLYRWSKVKYSGRSKIASAQIDPDFQWNLEVQRTDDSYLKEPVRLAPEKWYLRWVVWAQNVMMSFSWFA